ncbi:hypothetical protein IM774_11660 [Erysipelotrichaceae bacterium RD49]|nr:hypothetical protein [Erysipelotrichaceae bacterium RD49]
MNAKKILPALLLAGCFILTGCKAKSIELSIDPQSEMNPYKTVIVDVKTSPFPTKINPNSITINGGESWVEDGKIKFEADEPGDYTLQVDQDGVASNVLTITITPANPNPVANNNASSEESKNSESSANSKEEVDREFKDQKISVDAAYQNADKLIQNNTEVIVTGNLPQALIQDKNGNEVQVLWNSTTSEYIILQGFSIPFGGCIAQATGTLSRDASGQLVMNMTYISTDEEPAVRKDTDSKEDQDDHHGDEPDQSPAPSANQTDNNPSVSVPNH